MWPGCSSLRSLTQVRLLYIEEHSLAQLPATVVAPVESVAPDADSIVQATGAADSDGWLHTLAMSPLLHLLYQRRGAAGWQSWLRSFSELEVGEQEAVIQQGEVGDNFYIVKSGVAVVSSNAELAHIRPGGFFGEDALLSGQRRNAAVHMPMGGRVLRGDGAQLFTLVDDLWWALARNQKSLTSDNQLLGLRKEASTTALRDWLGALPADKHYAMSVRSEILVQDLLLLLMIHRGYSVGLR